MISTYQILVVNSAMWDQLGTSKARRVNNIEVVCDGVREVCNCQFRNQLRDFVNITVKFLVEDCLFLDENGGSVFFCNVRHYVKRQKTWNLNQMLVRNPDLHPPG